jgi:alpha-glucosidase
MDASSGRFRTSPRRGHSRNPAYSWWQRAIIYQIYPLSFQDTNGDGKGDLPGILSHLDYLERLGIDAVWLSPIYPSPMADFGYDITDFSDVDPVFGSLDDLDRLLKALHARDIRLLLDFVPNHTSELHPWFVESRSSRENPKRDWYVWVDPGPDGGPPNNWLSRFGGSAWEWDAATGQYYYHAFLKEQPDLNWRNPAVPAAMGDALRFWLRRGVDGFRIDAAAVLAEDALLRDDPPDPEANEHTPPPDRLKRVYTDSRPEVLDWLAELRAVVDEFPDRVLLGEVDISRDRVAQFYGDEERPIIHLPLNYGLRDTAWEAAKIATTIEEYRGWLPPHGWPNWVIGGHDKKRIASAIGPDQARVAAMLFLTLPGTALFYAGDELGMCGGPTKGQQVLDPFERRVPGYGLNRDPQRTPMQWDGSAHAGFTTGTPWLRVAEDYRVRNVEAEAADPHSILNLYRRLIALRHAEDALTVGQYTTVLVEGAIMAYSRAHAGRRILVLLNLSAHPQNCNLPRMRGGHVLLSTYLDGQERMLSDRITLRSNEGLIIELKRSRSRKNSAEKPTVHPSSASGRNPSRA